MTASPAAQSLVAVALVLLLLYLQGWAATREFACCAIFPFASVIARIPFVNAIYRNVRKLLAGIGEKPEGRQRILLIDFPSPEMKAIGLVKRFLRDADTDDELAAVQVPTSPSPTSGYLEIVPVSTLTATDWSLDQAMGFVVTGGASSPEGIRYREGTRSMADQPDSRRPSWSASIEGKRPLPAESNDLHPAEPSSGMDV